MQSHKGKHGFIVIKLDVCFPALLVMTFVAFLSFLTFVHILHGLTSATEVLQRRDGWSMRPGSTWDNRGSASKFVDTRAKVA